MTELAAEGLLTFDPGVAAWSWDLQGIHAKEFTDNVADLMASRLGRLPQDTLTALEQMACVGNVVHATTLATILGRSKSATQSALWPAINSALVSFQDGSYLFVHDRIHEAAYARIRPSDRSVAHLRIGRLLAARHVPGQPDGNIFEIVDQMVRGADLIESDDERRDVAQLNLAAGKRAKAGTAYASALRYLSSARSLLPKDARTSSYRLAFDIELGLAECEFLTGDLAGAEKRLASLLASSLNDADRAAATRVFLDLSVTMGDMDKANNIGLDYLRRVDPVWPLDVTIDEANRQYHRLMERLDQAPFEDLLELPPMTDPRYRATMDVLTALSASALFAGEALRQLVVCRMVAICLDHGNSDGAPLAYVLLGSIRGMFFNDYEGGSSLARIGLELVERPGLERFRARVYLGFGVHIANWTQPVDSVRSHFQRAFNAAQESGDVSFTAFSCVDTITNLLASGTSLVDVEREAERHREIVKGLRFDAIRRSIAQQLAVVRILRGQVPAAGSFDEAALAADGYEKLGSLEPVDGSARVREQGHRSLHAIGAIRELQARTFMQDYAAGLAAVERDPPLWTVPTQFERADYQFFAAISHAALCDAGSEGERQAHLEALAGHHGQMRRWADSCPATFESRAALLGAEIARLEARELDAERGYERAIRSAREQGFLQIEALAYESAAGFYAQREFDQISLLYLQNARRCYSLWGAEGKVQQLDARHPRLKDDIRSQGLRDTIGAPVEHLDLATVIKVSQAVSGELILDRLLDTLMRTAIEQAGAARGLLIVGPGSDPRITVEATVIQSGVSVELHDAMPTDATLPTSILHYVLRTQEVVVLDDASAQETFASDAYIRANKPRSVLCLPLLNQKRLLGAIYLENNLAPGVFAPARIPVLKLLASQAAISLENTRLYLDLAEREAKIRRLVDANIIGIFFWTSTARSSRRTMPSCGSSTIGKRMSGPAACVGLSWPPKSGARTSSSYSRGARPAASSSRSRRNSSAGTAAGSR